MIFFWKFFYTICKVSLSLYGRWFNVKNRLEEIRKENGRYNPSIILAFKIAKYFNLTIEDIFIYEEVEKNEKK
ncbi:hypothetical protein [uncultured Parvimonas sp.]|uniref:helix-turn-helix transcriptional regulator n=1 Tax=uncultured Parvimonas sp. TaxID=747372 RepID=UPI00338E9A4E